MKTTVIGREELIDMFEDINNQLEQLDNSIKTNMSRQQHEWHRKQEQRMDFCDKQLKSLEVRVASVNERQEQTKKTSFKVTLSY